MDDTEMSVTEKEAQWKQFQVATTELKVCTKENLFCFSSFLLGRVCDLYFRKEKIVIW